MHTVIRSRVKDDRLYVVISGPATRIIEQTVYQEYIMFPNGTTQLECEFTFEDEQDAVIVFNEQWEKQK